MKTVREILAIIALCISFTTFAQTTFVHQATTSNTNRHITTINNGATNNQSNKLLFITEVFSGKYNNNSLGVWYNNGKWTIYQEDKKNLKANENFNVLAVNPSNNAFQHQATVSNTSGHITTINHPSCNNNPNAVLLVTQNWKSTYNPNPIGVWYNNGKWTIFNQGGAAMQNGVNFNVLVLKKGQNLGGTASIFTSTASTVNKSYKHLADLPYKGKNVKIFTTQNYGQNGPYNNHETAVWNYGSNWTVYNKDRTNLPANTKFNMLVIDGNEILPPDEEIETLQTKFTNEPQLIIPVQSRREEGFRVLINGIHCLQSADGGNGTDEPYIEVYVDGSSTPVKFGSRPMNESDRSWYEQFTDAVESLTRVAQQEFWLMPGSVYAKRSVRIVLWEEDDGRGDSPFINNDDKIGEFTIYSSTPDNNYIKKSFRGDEGDWDIVVTKQTRGSINTAVEGDAEYVPVRVPILNQGSEGACVAFSTVGALTTSYLNQTKSGSSKEDLFDPIALYNRRGVVRDRSTGVTAKSGWYIDECLNLLLKEGIPFRNNTSKKLLLKSYYTYYSDGRVMKSTLGSNGNINTTQVSSGGDGHNKMRAVLKTGQPLIVDYAVYPDFMAYAKVQGTYGGNISDDHKKASGHAVFVTGYMNPPVGSNEFPKWILQNSWGSTFGFNGRCIFAEGACHFDDIMYQIGDFEIVYN